MALLLSFDTATPHLAVVLSDGESPLAWREDPGPALSHAELLNVFIAGVLSDADVRLNDLKAVAAGTGPGSYTGLRIGLSSAKGLCFALDKPLIGMGTLEVLLHQVLATGPVLGAERFFPMVDARRMEVYTRAFGATGQALDDTRPLVLDEAWCAAQPAGTVVFGDGADKAADLWRQFPQVLHLPGIRPAVQGLARCAHVHAAAGSFADLAYLVPEYGKPANVAQKRGKE